MTLVYTGLSSSPCASAGQSDPSLMPSRSVEPSSMARSFRQQEKAGQKAVDAFTELKQLVPVGLDSDQTANYHNLYASCGEHIGMAAKSTCGQDFAKHYSNAFHASKEIQSGFPANTASCGMIQAHLTPLFEGMTDLSQAAFIHQNGTKDASNLSEDRLHDFWVKGHKLNETKTAYDKAFKEYASELGTSMQTGSSPASHSNNETGVPTGPIYAGDTVTTPTQTTSEEAAGTYLGTVLDNIRKLVPGANQQTNKELTDRLLAMCTPDSNALDIATAAQETSQLPKTEEHSMLMKYQMPKAQALAVDITLPTAKKFGNSEAASDSLQALYRIETLVPGQYNWKDDEARRDFQAQIEENPQVHRESIQRINAIDYFFLLSKNLDNFRHGPYAIPEEYLAEFELSPEERQEYQALDNYITQSQLNHSRKTVSTLHPGGLATQVFTG